MSIVFPGHSSWVACSQLAMKRWAQSAEINLLSARLLFAALSRHDTGGHAPFAPNELRELLGTHHVATGEVDLLSSEVLANTIRSAKRIGFIGEDSRARCLVLSPDVFQRGRGARLACIHDQR